MKSKAPMEKQWRVVQVASDEAKRIRTKVGRLLGELAEKVNDKRFGGVEGVTVIPVNDGACVATFVCEFGRGRLKLLWQTDDTQLTGRLVFEREMMDAHDRTYWEPSLNFYIPNTGRLIIGDDQAANDQTTDYRDDDRNFVVILSMMYAVINGPVA